MTVLEYFIKAFFGLYPRPVSRRAFVNLTCDNAALTSALEQKERARAGAMSEIQRLRRALNDAQHAIETQETAVVQFESVYRVCYVDGQGFGYMDPAGWANTPQAARGRVQVFALCPSEEAAQMIVKGLPRGWQDSMTYYNPRTNEARWAISEVER